MAFEGWTEDDLRARIEELRPAVEEYEALSWMQMVEYLETEGFISQEDGRLYIEGEACDVDL